MEANPDVEWEKELKQDSRALWTWSGRATGFQYPDFSKTDLDRCFITDMITFATLKYISMNTLTTLYALILSHLCNTCFIDLPVLVA